MLRLRDSPKQDWLTGHSSYQAFVSSLSTADPRLSHRDPKAVAQKIPWLDYGRVVSLEAGDDNSFGEVNSFSDPGSLESHLAKQGSRVGKRVVYIMEGLGPGFVGVLGHHFQLHPSVFIDHERVVVMNQTWQGESDGVPLVSLLQGRDHVRLKYFEPLQFSKPPTSFRLACGHTGRHIGVSRSDDKFTDVGVVRRKCTMWNRRTEGGGWECAYYQRCIGIKTLTSALGLVICDPAVTTVCTGDYYQDRYDVVTKPYQGGYVDFVPQAAQIRHAKSGPPRTSFLDDIVFYLQTHARDTLSQAADLTGSDPMADPDLVVGTFVRKIVASHYFKLAEHVRATLSVVQRGLSRKHDLTTFPMEKVEALWSDIQAWDRRVGSEYCEDLEAILFQLGIPIRHPDTSEHHRDGIYRPTSPSFPLQHDSVPGTPASGMSTAVGEGLDADCFQFQRQQSELQRWLSPMLDFQFLLLRFRELRHRVECLNSAVTGLASITGNRQAYREQQLALETARRSIREAKSSKAITLLSLIFIPMAYTSSLFSMSVPYGPGQEQFWLYFATAVPLILVVLAGYYILDFGYTDDGSSWSLDVFMAALEAWLGRRRRRQDGEGIELESSRR